VVVEAFPEEGLFVLPSFAIVAGLSESLQDECGLQVHSHVVVLGLSFCKVFPEISKDSVFPEISKDPCGSEINKD